MRVANEIAGSTGPLRKGIVLAGGRGTRLYPMTQYISKHLLPVYDKPMIYYPLTTLMLAGIREILVISDPRDLPNIRNALGDGSKWGINLSYAEQDRPAGIAESILIAERFTAGEAFALILGDNIYYGYNFGKLLRDAAAMVSKGAVVFTQWVDDPGSYGVLQIDSQGKAVSLEEKPKTPLSNQAVTGLYFYDYRATDLARQLKPSERGELEITDLNRLYLKDGTLNRVDLGRGYIWFDAGTARNLLLASHLVETIQTRQRTGIAFPEEVAFRNGYISIDELTKIIAELPSSAYKEYLMTLPGEAGP